MYELKVLLRGIGLNGWQPVGLRSSGSDSADGKSFAVENEEPQFVFRKPLPAGWYVIEFAIKADNPDAARLYYDLGDGFCEENSIVIPFKKGNIRKRFFHIPQKCQGLRFDPVESESEFVICRFKIKRVPKRFALKRIYRKLASARSKRLPDEPMRAYDRLFLKPVNLNYSQFLTDIEPRLHLSQRAASQKVISILMPVYNPEPERLAEAIKSVMSQTYPHWQLCIADDHSTRRGVVDVIKKYANRDVRVRAVLRSRNGHISRASNSALELCTGEFVALMDHDDLLPPYALNEVAQVIASTPDVNIIYTDEDKIDDTGKRSEPNFKPDWNPDLLYSQNYISHLGVYRRSLIIQVGGFRVGFEGAQDHDLVLRCAAACGGKGIVHVPRVLYHWRVGEGSCALGPDEKDYTTDAGIRAVSEVLGDHIEKVTKGRYPNTYRVYWRLPAAPPMVSLIMPTFNGMAITRRAIDSILEKTIYDNYEIIIVDNNSDDPEALRYFEEAATHPKISVVQYPKSFNFSAINNFAVQHARGDILGFVNNDIEVITEDWLSEMVAHVARPEIGCVGAKLYYPDGRLQHAGVVLGIGGVAGHSHKYFDGDETGYCARMHLTQNYSAVTAACLLVRTSVFKEVNGFNEKDLAIAFNDVDFCLKVRACGYRNLWTPYAELYHHESVSRGAEDSPEKVKRFQGEIKYMINRWGEELVTDPCYSPNLTLKHENFTLRSAEERFEDDM